MANFHRRHSSQIVAICHIFLINPPWGVCSPIENKWSNKAGCWQLLTVKCWIHHVLRASSKRQVVMHLWYQVWNNKECHLIWCSNWIHWEKRRRWRMETMKNPRLMVKANPRDWWWRWIHHFSTKGELAINLLAASRHIELGTRTSSNIRETTIIHDKLWDLRNL